MKKVLIVLSIGAAVGVALTTITLILKNNKSKCEAKNTAPNVQQDDKSSVICQETIEQVNEIKERHKVASDIISESINKINAMKEKNKKAYDEIDSALSLLSK